MLAICDRPRLLAICDRPRRLDTADPIWTDPDLLGRIFRLKGGHRWPIARALRTLAWSALQHWWDVVIPYYLKTLRLPEWRKSELRRRWRRQDREIAKREAREAARARHASAPP